MPSDPSRARAEAAPDRRPIAARQSGWAATGTRFLLRLGLSPNQISVASMVFAGLAALAFIWGGDHALGLVLAALCCQLRLLCNLFDGLVAVEGGKGGPDGPFWNEAPDRISDALILTGFGFAAGRLDLGLAATALAILTAYLRELGRANGAGNDFCGPLAKPQRMALVTGAALLQAGVFALGADLPLLLWALWLLLLGTAVTVLRRAYRQLGRLRG